MPRKTLREARRSLEENASALNPEAYRQYQAEVNQAAGVALARATEFVDKATNDVIGRREEVLRELVRIRDELLALADSGASGGVEARDLNEQLAKLHREFRDREKDVAEVDRTAELVQRIEDDPEAWADSLAERFPHMLYEFSF